MRESTLREQLEKEREGKKERPRTRAMKKIIIIRKTELKKTSSANKTNDVFMHGRYLYLWK